jgi:hypothetical protein
VEAAASVAVGGVVGDQVCAQLLVSRVEGSGGGGGLLVGGAGVPGASPGAARLVGGHAHGDQRLGASMSPVTKVISFKEFDVQ